MEKSRDRIEICKAVASAVAIIALAVLGQVVTGCAPRIIYQTKVEHSTDTLIRERVLRDTVKVPVPYEVERNVTLDDSSHVETSLAESDAVIRDGRLFHSIRNRMVEVEVPVDVSYRDTTIREMSDHETVRTETVYVERRLTWWQRLRLDLFPALVSALVLMAGVCLWIKGNARHKAS